MSISRRIPGLLGAVVVALLLSGQLAAGAADHEPSYTGCLRTGGTNPGTLVATKVGSVPLRPCNQAEQQVRLSGGDITQVSAGTGLRVTSALVTDSSGAVSLDLAPKYRLPQDCAVGQVVQRTASGWGCLSVPAPKKVYLGASSNPSGGGSIIGDDWSVLGKALEVPAGSYSIIAKVMLGAEKILTGETIADCRLDVTGAQYRDWVAVYNDDIHAPVSLETAWTSDKPFHIAVVCADSGFGAAWSNLKILAIPSDAVTGQDLGH